MRTSRWILVIVAWMIWPIVARGQTDTPTPTFANTLTATPTITVGPSNTPTVTSTGTHTANPSFTPTPTNTVTSTPTRTETKTLTATRTASSTKTPIPTRTAINTPTPPYTPVPIGYFCGGSATGAATLEGTTKANRGHKTAHLDMGGTGVTAQLTCQVCPDCVPIAFPKTPVAADDNIEFDTDCDVLGCKITACTSGTCTLRAYLKQP